MTWIRYAIPNLATAANIAVGYVGILVAIEGRYDLAARLLFVAILLDTVDGRLARWLSATSRFGQELDSLCDALSFGAAPALLAYLVFLRDLGGVGVATSLVFLLAGVLRLARFNVTSDAHGKAARTMGVPIPIAAGYVIVAVLVRDSLSPALGAGLVLLLAAGMVSRWALPELSGRSLVSAMLLVGILNYTAVVVWPNWYTIAWWNIWNVAILLAARGTERGLVTAS